MRAAAPDQLQGGICMELAPEVLDKYFFPEPVHERFQLMIGKTICAHCPIRPDCLEEAIVEPPGFGVRGGETSAALWRLHDRWMNEHIDADILAAEAIAGQKGIRSLRSASRAQHGMFPDVPLAFPEMGGPSWPS
jgi:hypothetical protein